MKYGVPHYNSDGRLTGMAYDNDGDGIYDDYTEVVSDPISSGDGFSVVGADNDGDGIYDDHVYVVHSNAAGNTTGNTTNTRRESYSHGPTSNSYSSQPIFSTKGKLKAFIITLLVLAGIGILSRIAFGIFSLILRIF